VARITQDRVVRPHDHPATVPDQPDNEFVFTAEGGTWLWRSTFIRRVLKPAVNGNEERPRQGARAVPIRPGLTFHGLRHSHKTWLIAGGAVSAQDGHVRLIAGTAASGEPVYEVVPAVRTSQTEYEILGSPALATGCAAGDRVRVHPLAARAHADERMIETGFPGS
jgi:hypothetical protein